MPSLLTSTLREFTNPRDERQLARLQASVAGCDPKQLSSTDQRAMLGVFERFPEDDGFGTFWTLLHKLEASAGYEPVLVQSTLRHPADFNVLMIRRLLNSGISEVDGVSLLGVLATVSERADAPQEVREDVKRYLRERSSAAGEA